MKSESTRDINPDMILKCQDDNCFKPFVDFVRRTEDLELCFRGNDSKMGTVTIYRNNHMIWALKCVDKPTIEISTNHCRFMYDWDSYVLKGLFELGFTKDGNEYKGTFEQFSQQYPLAERIERVSTKEDETGEEFNEPKIDVSYDAIKLKYIYSGKETKKDIEYLIYKSYAIICRMQNEFFNPLGFNVQCGEVSGIKDYVKGFCLGKSKDDILLNDCDKALLSNPQPCVEKHIQQELFRTNKSFSKGLFIYDLEFIQPPKEDLPIFENKTNKPDMFAIRFEKKSHSTKKGTIYKPVSICLVEVKSTQTALKGQSGVKNHLAGMLEYASCKKLMDDRRKEAYRIIGQYKSLNLRNVPEDFKLTIDDFMKLPVEIIFVFSHGYHWATKITNDKNVYKTIEEINAQNNAKKDRLVAGSPVIYSSFSTEKEHEETISAYLISLKER